MQVLRDLEQCPVPPVGTVVTIGAYDGVHRGHREVIAQVQRRAAERGLETAVVTFDRHPASVVRPDSAPALLTDLVARGVSTDGLEVVTARAMTWPNGALGSSWRR